MNPKTGGVFASFGAHPNFEIALERSLTELLQGRSFEGLNDVPRPTFNSLAVTEPENFIEHFIDSTGIISWRFFSAKKDYDFCEWGFSGSSEEESDHLFAILKALGKEAYIAVFDNLGATACRILVPDYSEVYPVEDLIWDNTNKALHYREDILNLHSLNDESLTDLLTRLEESQLDNYTDIRTLIGIEFDENTVWGQMTILELKILINLALSELDEAYELVGEFLQFNDNTVERGLFYQAIHTVLEIALDDEMVLEDFIANLNRMFGKKTMANVIGSVNGQIKFFGLTQTSMKLEGLDKHLRLIESYKKLHHAREKMAIVGNARTTS
jgi:ribosomal protein S12 methylthiotransferase accessory factor|tara:strand:- start:529 stop:1512 length:984 start_codon:yes stop_codon:yes gene_type:complete